MPKRKQPIRLSVTLSPETQAEIDKIRKRDRIERIKDVVARAIRHYAMADVGEAWIAEDRR